MHSDSRRRGQQSHNFRQLETGELLTVGFTSPPLCLVYLVRFRPTHFLCSSDLFKPPLTSSGFDILRLYLRNGKSNLFDFCDGRIICVCSSVKSVFVLLLLCACLCYTVQGILQEQLCSLYLSFLKFSHSEKWKSLSC